MTNDNFSHFVEAQNPVYSQVIAELTDGKKKSHWMWFIFPQIAGLGRSTVSQRYSLASIDEAKDYLAHPILGGRLRQATDAVMTHVGSGLTAHEIFGSLDDLKFHSSMTLFHIAAPQEKLFADALGAWFDTAKDHSTLSRV